MSRRPGRGCRRFLRRLAPNKLWWWPLLAVGIGEKDYFFYSRSKLELLPAAAAPAAGGAAAASLPGRNHQNEDD